MMNKRQEKLVKDYGPVCFNRMSRILDELQYLAADAQSVLTDVEWKNCGEEMIRFKKELMKVREMVFNRMEEVGAELD